MQFLHILLISLIPSAQQVKAVFSAMPPDFQKPSAFWNVPMHLPFVFLVRETRRWKSMEHWWNYIDRVKPMYLEKTPSQPHFVHHKSHKDWPDIEPVPPRWDAGGNQPEPRHGRRKSKLKQSFQLVPRSKHSVSVIKTSQLMLYREIIAVCSKVRTEHINTLCGQNVELLNVKLAVHIVTERVQVTKEAVAAWIALV
jgi:hypothetical protein